MELGGLEECGRAWSNHQCGIFKREWASTGVYENYARNRDLVGQGTAVDVEWFRVVRQPYIHGITRGLEQLACEKIDWKSSERR
jgi:hypothetical protein